MHYLRDCANFNNPADSPHVVLVVEDVLTELAIKNTLLWGQHDDPKGLSALGLCVFRDAQAQVDETKLGKRRSLSFSLFHLSPHQPQTTARLQKLRSIQVVFPKYVGGFTLPELDLVADRMEELRLTHGNMQPEKFPVLSKDMPELFNVDSKTKQAKFSKLRELVIENVSFGLDGKRSLNCDVTHLPNLERLRLYLPDSVRVRDNTVRGKPKGLAIDTNKTGLD